MRPLCTVVCFFIALFAAPAFGGSQPLVSVAWLDANKHHVSIIDLRSKLGLGKGESYEAGHIPGAVKSDYLKAGWRTTRNGVIGVLPEVEVLEGLIGDLGVANEDHVILVTAGNNPTDFGSAARIFWTFKYLGHDRVSILDGGQKAWVDAKLPLSKAVPTLEAEIFSSAPRVDMVATLDDVKMTLNRDDVQLLDARSRDQFIGKKKHRKAVRFGRLPGATHLDNHAFFTPDGGRLANDRALANTARSSFRDDKSAISYCNTGHWAATNWFVLTELLGKKSVQLYDGSLVEWTARADLPLHAGQSIN